MWITVINWDKYNPRSDVKSTHWFRLENDFYVDPLLTPLDSDGKVVWLTLLAHASKAQSKCFEIDHTFLSRLLRIDESKFQNALNHFQTKEKIQIHTSRPRNVRVTPTSRPRTATEHNGTDGTDRTGRTYKGAVRVKTWEPEHPLARCFANLMAIPPYADAFDLARDTVTLEAHQKRHGLSLADLEQVTWEYRCWADGPALERIRSPRGTLATFVANYVKRPKEKRGTSASTLDELYPTITSAEDCY